MLADIVRKDTGMIPYMPTDTLYDLGTGAYQPSIDNRWVLNGGLSPFLGVTGKGGLYKSGTLGSLMANAMVLHPESEAYVYETEGMITDATRYNDFVGQDISPRINLVNQPQMNLTDFQSDLQAMGEEKLKHKKDYIRPTPFVDRRTGKPIMAWLPTFIVGDSYSQAISAKGIKLFAENDIDDSSMNTFWLHEGNVKTKLNREFSTMASKYGFYFMFTVHLGDKKELDPYAKSTKQLQHMKQTDKMKNAGSNFEFLVMSLIQCLRAVTLQTKQGECEYPSTHSTPIEVNQVDTMLLKGKNNASGLKMSFILSQYVGILNHLTNFELLKSNGNFGLDVKGNNMSFDLLAYPNHPFNRRNIREKMDASYEMRRALELTAQLCYIQTFWSTYKLPPFVRMNPVDFAERLTRSTKPSVSDILNSTGSWSTSKQERQRMTIMDVLAILSLEKAPSKLAA